jgi:NodT family efflux transporter outer membrane factor (OMF) lipoprotein
MKLGNSRWFRLLLVMVLCGTFGCTGPREYLRNRFKVGPDYCRPEAPAAYSWIDAADARVRSDMHAETEWWNCFGDPCFHQLICDAYQQNLTLRIAGFRILEARASRCIAVGGLFPQNQQAYGDYVHSQRSNQAIALPSPRQFNNWDLGFAANWQIDFWGKYRRAIETADAALDASIENYDYVLNTLISDTATAYINFRTNQQRIEYIQANITAQKGALEIAEARAKAGAASDLDVEQAKTNLGQTEAALPQIEAAQRLAGNQLCVLMGIPPEELSNRLGIGPIPQPVSGEVVVGIPADLLRRRPDVRTAERNLAAQSAQIGLAEADLYPALTLNGDVSVRAQSFNKLFDAGASAYSFGPSLRWNILNYARIKNNVLLQNAKFRELAVTYQNAALTANRETEDGIVQFIRAQERLKHLKEAADAAARSNDLVLKVYREGKADFNRVYTVQSLLAQQQDAMAQAAGLVATNLVQIYRALGGGWQIRLEQPGPTWCDDCLRLPTCCCDDYCPKPCPTSPSCPTPGTCGPPEISYPCPNCQ